MLMAKLVRLETAWSAMPQLSRRTALARRRWKTDVRDFASPGTGVPLGAPASAAICAAQLDNAEHDMTATSMACMCGIGTWRQELSAVLAAWHLVGDADRKQSADPA